jgi:hypothetical protein
MIIFLIILASAATAVAAGLTIVCSWPGPELDDWLKTGWT